VKNGITRSPLLEKAWFGNPYASSVPRRLHASRLYGSCACANVNAETASGARHFNPWACIASEGAVEAKIFVVARFRGMSRDDTFRLRFCDTKPSERASICILHPALSPSSVSYD